MEKIITRMRRGLSIALAVGVCASSGQARATTTIHSYNGQFIVSAPDVTYASEVAQRCERITEQVNRQFGVRRLWDGAASVLIVRWETEIDGTRETRWDVCVARENVAQTAQGLSFGRIDGFLQRAVCFHVLRDIARSAVEAHETGEPTIPPWLVVGLTGLLDPEQRPDLFHTTTTAIEEERSFSLEDMFAHTGEFDTEAPRAVFDQQAATVVDFLLGQRRGPERLRKAIAHQWRRSTLTFSLRWEYRDLYATLDEMAVAWETYVRERPLQMIGVERLTLPQTDAKLVELLQIEIPVIDAVTIEESIIQTDLEGLSTHTNLRVVQTICAEKSGQILQLMMRSAPEFRPTLEAYGHALMAIRDGKRGTFRRWYKRARHEHEAVRQSPYFSTD